MATDDDRAELRAALKDAIHGEIRYGIKDAAREELDHRLDRVVQAIETLCLKPRKK